MKNNFFLFFLLVFNSLTSHGQLIINNSASSGNFVPFRDTTLTSFSQTYPGFCSSNNFSFDLNQDSIVDINFYLSCYSGGFGSSNDVIIKTFNDFYIHSDANYVEHYQYIAPDALVHDTTRFRTVVKKYNWGDTIYSSQSTLATNLSISQVSHGNSPSVIFTNIHPFLYNTSYIVIETAAHDLYYFKIYQSSSNSIQLMRVKSNILFLTEFVVFPNPTNNLLFFNQPYEHVQIYNLFGCLVSDQMNVYESIDVSNLSSGTYFIVAEEDGTIVKSKFVKLTP